MGTQGNGNGDGSRKLLYISYFTVTLHAKPDGECHAEGMHIS